MDQNDFEFNSACERAKKAYQAEISSLIELHGHLQGQYIDALRTKKHGVFIPNKEMKVILQAMLDIAGNQLAHYITIDNTNRNAMRLYNCSLKIREKKTPNLNELLR